MIKFKRINNKKRSHQEIIPTIKIKKEDYKGFMNIINATKNHYIVQAYTVAKEDMIIRSHIAKKFVYNDKDAHENSSYTFSKCGKHGEGKIIRTIKKGEFIRHLNSTSIKHKYNSTQDNMLNKLEIRKIPKPKFLEYTLAKMRERLKKKT